MGHILQPRLGPPGSALWCPVPTRHHRTQHQHAVLCERSTSRAAGRASAARAAWVDAACGPLRSTRPSTHFGGSCKILNGPRPLRLMPSAAHLPACAGLSTAGLPFASWPFGPMAPCTSLSQRPAACRLPPPLACRHGRISTLHHSSGIGNGRYRQRVMAAAVMPYAPRAAAAIALCCSHRAFARPTASARQITKPPAPTAGRPCPLRGCIGRLSLEGVATRVLRALPLEGVAVCGEYSVPEQGVLFCLHLLRALPYAASGAAARRRSQRVADPSHAPQNTCARRRGGA
jgi:hypothetical protein